MSQPATFNPADYQDYHRKKPQQQQQQQPQQQTQYASYAPQAPPPPFQGPPPMPQSMSNVSASQWSNGYWSFNPSIVPPPAPTSSTSSASAPSSKPATFNPANVRGGPQPNASVWAPGGAWGGAQAQQQYAAQQQQQQADFNPYKRQTKAPSAEYLAMPEVVNALGLHDMKPRRWRRSYSF
ncbi:hypothetical protein BDV98DRAFT_93665 [Pterulicium gracile]|uniref:Uncharacterized protein n=1 Tax=Pterulicium gracile TaxID=1884261 RepID=A0A5C3QHX8_9AGAR|nr:hypothetical protein BDV98DRAFT_93665 [Pterula gracilis]